MGPSEDGMVFSLETRCLTRRNASLSNYELYLRRRPSLSGFPHKVFAIRDWERVKREKKWFFRLTTLFIFLLVHLPSRLKREEETFNNFLFSCRFHVFTNPLNKKCCAPWLCREGNLNNHLRDAEYGFDAVSVVSCMRSSALYALKSFSYQCKFSSRPVLRSSNYSKAKKSVRSTPSPESQMEVLHLKFSFDTTCQVLSEKG